MPFLDVFSEIKNKVSDADTSGIEGKLAVQVNLTGKDEGIFYLEVNDGALSVEPYNYYDNDAVIIVDPLDLNKILDGRLDPVYAFNTGKLQIEGNIKKAIVLNNLIVKKNSQKEEKVKFSAKTKTADKAKIAHKAKFAKK